MAFGAGLVCSSPEEMAFAGRTLRIVESLRLVKTFEIIESNHKP